MNTAAGGPAQGTTHVFAIRSGRSFDDTKAYSTRRPHKKSKTGCIACKTKRVKCGEEKPSCSRCNRLKTACRYEGHEASVAVAPSARSQSVVPPGAVLQRLPTTLSKTPVELSLMKHYDAVTSQKLDTITFSNIIAGDRSPQYRAIVLDQAKQHPHLMHSMLAVAALHLDQFGNKAYRRAGLAHLQVALPKFRESVVAPIVPHDSPHILYSAMLITLHYFCIDSKSVADSWVFSRSPDRLAWLSVQQGLNPLFNTTRQHHKTTYMAPVFELVSGDDAADKGLPFALLALCGYTPAATERDLQRNPYVQPLQQLNALMPLEHNVPNVLKYLRFMASFDRRFFALVSENDQRALLIMAYGFALMCDVELWWTQPRARRDCWAICSYLDMGGDEKVRALLGFPAKACGYRSVLSPDETITNGRERAP